MMPTNKKTITMQDQSVSTTAVIAYGAFIRKYPEILI